MKKKVWLTVFRAIDPADGILKSWAGPNIHAVNGVDAYIQLKSLKIHDCFLEPHDFAE